MAPTARWRQASSQTLAILNQQLLNISFLRNTLTQNLLQHLTFGHRTNTSLLLQFISSLVFIVCYFSEQVTRFTLNPSVSQGILWCISIYKQKRHNIPISLIDLALKLENNGFCKCIHAKTEDRKSFPDPELMMRIYTSNLWWQTSPDHLMFTWQWTSKTALRPLHSMGADFQQNMIIPLISYAYCHGSFIESFFRI